MAEATRLPSSFCPSSLHFEPIWRTALRRLSRLPQLAFVTSVRTTSTTYLRILGPCAIDPDNISYNINLCFDTLRLTGAASLGTLLSS